MPFLDNLRTITQEVNIETRPMTPFFFIYFFRSNCYSKFIFMWSPIWSLLVCKTPRFLAKSYQFRQLIALFQKVDTLMLLKLYTMFCPPTRAKYQFFQAPAHGLLTCFSQFNTRSPRRFFLSVQLNFKQFYRIFHTLRFLLAIPDIKGQN